LADSTAGIYLISKFPLDACLWLLYFDNKEESCRRIWGGCKKIVI